MRHWGRLLLPLAVVGLALALRCRESSIDEREAAVHEPVDNRELDRNRPAYAPRSPDTGPWDCD